MKLIRLLLPAAVHQSELSATQERTSVQHRTDVKAVDGTEFKECMDGQDVQGICGFLRRSRVPTLVDMAANSYFGELMTDQLDQHHRELSYKARGGYLSRLQEKRMRLSKSTLRQPR
ncbi:hypothetical protein WJX74_003351 [Apatococcus lobatus]|uniref:Uncharacterized protein n=1 Tax=Apatococcus lobatus TaxID=904363 RepID=A0AAW1RB78_9CHLO